MSAEVGAFGEVLTEETVGVLIRATLPWRVWVAEVEISICAGLVVLGHLSTLVPGQRAAELFGQCRDRQRDSVAHGLGAVAGQSGPILDPFPFAMAWHGWGGATAS